MLDKSIVIRKLAGEFFVLTTPRDENFGILVAFAECYIKVNVSEL